MKIRTFIAIDLPPELLRALADVQANVREVLRAHELATALRWSLAQNLHLTLRFLGDTDGAQQAKVTAEMLTVGVKTAPLRLQVDVSGRALGAFPNLRQPRVLWSGVEGDVVALRQLQGAMERIAQEAGFAQELKPYAPHLTLARAARNVERRTLTQVGRAVGDWMHEAHTQMPDGKMMEFVVDRVVLYQSELGAGGTRYTPLATVPLVGV